MEKDNALQGIKVLECCDFVAGPYCCKLMADLGAQVVKIEKPGLGDVTRRLGPFPNDIPHSEKSGLFAYLNTSKFGITLDLQSPRGKQLLHTLVKKFDVLVEDSAPEATELLGLDYKTINKINPGMIVSSITPFGCTGPYSNYKAYTLNTYQSGGEGYLTPSGQNYPESRPPLKTGGNFAEYEIGITTAVGILAALFARNLSGRGQHIDISKQEVLLHMNGVQLCEYAESKSLPTRSTHGSFYGGPFRCKDGYIELVLLEDHQWQGFLEIMGAPKWADDPKFKDHVSRCINGKEVNMHLSEWITNHTKEEIYHKAQKAGCPVAPFYTAEDIVNSKQLAEREFFAEIDHPFLGKLRFPSAPYKLTETPWAVQRPAPLLGEHNEMVYGDWLGLEQEEIRELKESGVM